MIEITKEKMGKSVNRTTDNEILAMEKKVEQVYT
jgi:hypothetical protein